MQSDTIIIGGGFAGLSAATYLGRARRKVQVLDTGKPRNRFSSASHGFLGQDGRAPLDILSDARLQLKSYPTVSVRTTAAQSAQSKSDGFSVGLDTGETLHTRTLILAFGLRDTLPDIPGLAARWGISVLHCPYCHGFGYSDRSLGVLYRNEMSVHQAQLITEWGPTTLFLNGHELATEQSGLLIQRGVQIEPRPLAALEGEGTNLSNIRLQGGHAVEIEALYVVPQSAHASSLAALLGVKVEEAMMGPLIVTDETKMTSQPGVYAAGDIARAPHSVSWAVSDGVTAGTAVHRALVFGK